MSSHHKLYAAYLSIVTGFCIAASYNMKFLSEKLHLDPNLIALMSFIVSGSSASLVAWFLIQIRTVRKYIVGNTWVEGWWLLLTYDSEGKNEHAGLLQIKHVGNLKFEGLAYYSNATYAKLTARSFFLALDEHTFRYINYARVTDTMPDYEIIAFGHMDDDQGETHPRFYAGRRVSMDTHEVKWQSMSKIDSDIIRKFRRDSTRSWLDRLLKRNRKPVGTWRDRLMESSDIKPFYEMASRKGEHFRPKPAA